VALGPAPTCCAYTNTHYKLNIIESQETIILNKLFFLGGPCPDVTIKTFLGTLIRANGHLNNNTNTKVIAGFNQGYYGDSWILFING
jgi:hypothetical protein